LVLHYELRLHKGVIRHPDLDNCLGVCDSVACTIDVSDAVPSAKRMRIFAHELAHAIKEECDAHHATLIDEETHCELASMGTLLAPKLLARVYIYLTWGIEVEDVMFIPGVEEPIPVVGY